MARVLFLQDIEYEFIGPMYLSSVAKQNGHECKLLIGRKIEDFAEEIEKGMPDIIAFSIMTGSHVWAINMAGQVKDRYGIPNIFGGAHPTFFSEMIEEPKIDMLVRGEGEDAFIDVLNAIDSKVSMDRISNLYLKKPDGTIIRNEVRALFQDLDIYPFPDRHLYDCLNGKIDRSIVCVITSRGCPYHCNFCFQDSMREMYRGKGKYIRIRKTGHIIDECKRIQAELKPKAIYFRDDVFGINRQWLYEFLKVYKHEVGIDFMCLVRADIVASDEKYAQNLADAGCRMVFWGIESGSERIRNLVLNKQLSNEKILKTSEYLRKAGIEFLTFNMMGLPGETLEDALSTVELNIAIKTNYPWCSLFFPLPRTKLTDYAVDKGFLEMSYHHEIHNKTFYSSSSIKGQHINEIENLQRLFQTAVLWPSAYPLIKRLIKLEPNRIFRWWFALVYFYVHMKSENRNFWLTLKFALRNFRTQLGKD